MLLELPSLAGKVSAEHLDQAALSHLVSGLAAAARPGLFGVWDWHLHEVTVKQGTHAAIEALPASCQPRSSRYRPCEALSGSLLVPHLPEPWP